MKILILANNDAGLYKFRKELIEVLIKEHDVFICLPNGNYIEELTKMGCKFIECEIDRRGTNIIKDFNLMNFYKKSIKRINPDIVFTYTIKPNIYGGLACQGANVPYVANITGLGTAFQKEGLLKSFASFLYKTGLKKANKVFFQNIEDQKYMIDNNIVKNNYDLLPGSGVNVEDFNYMEYPNDKNIEFAFVARIMKEKGIEEYLEACKAIKSRHPNTIFHICGFYENDDYKQQIEELCQKGIIQNHGNVNSMKDIYKLVHCVCVTSHTEGMSNVILEASACGRPAIASNIPGCKEAVDDSKTGYIFEVNNTDDLIEKMETFINLSNEERKQMGRNAREKVRKEFDRKIVINKYLEEINKI